MKKKLYTILALLIALSLVFSACSAPAPAESTASEATDTGTEESAEADAEANQEEVTLNFLGFKHGAEIGNMNEIIEGFETEYPHINVEYEGISTESGYTTVMNTRLNSGSDLDVFMIFGSMPDLIDGGHLLDISDTDYAQRLPESLKTFVSQDGKQYACYANSAAMALFVNKTMLEEHGIETPTNWGEFITACDELKAAGELPMVMGNEIGWSPLVITYCMTNARLQNSGELESAEAALLSGEMAAGDMFLDAFNELAMMRENAYYNVDTAEGMLWNEETFASFANGDAGFMIGGSWQVAQINNLEDNELNYEVVAFPGQIEGEAIGTLLPAIPMAINANSEHLEEAKLFMDYFFSDENSKAWSESQAAMSPLNGITVELAEELTPFIETVAAGNGGPYELKTIADFEMQETIKAAAQSVISGDKTPEQAAQEVTDFFEMQQALG